MQRTLTTRFSQVCWIFFYSRRCFVNVHSMIHSHLGWVHCALLRNSILSKCFQKAIFAIAFKPTISSQFISFRLLAQRFISLNSANFLCQCALYCMIIHLEMNEAVWTLFRTIQFARKVHSYLLHAPLRKARFCSLDSKCDLEVQTSYHRSSCQRMLLEHAVTVLHSAKQMHQSDFGEVSCLQGDCVSSRVKLWEFTATPSCTCNVVGQIASHASL